MILFSICYLEDKAVANKIGVADRLPEGKASLHTFTCSYDFCHSSLCLSGGVAYTHTHRAKKTQGKARKNTGPPPEPTITSRDPEDLCDVHGNDVEAAGSPLGQEPDHHLQELLNEDTETCFTS